MVGTIECYLDEVNDLTSYVLKGKVEADQIITTINAFYQGKPTKYVLWNSSQAQIAHISNKDVERIVNTVENYADRRIVLKTALVFSEDVAFGIGRMFELLGEMRGLPPRFENFRNIDEAMTWLGIIS